MRGFALPPDLPQNTKVENMFFVCKNKGMDNITPIQYAAEKGVCLTTVYRWMKLGMPHGSRPNCTRYLREGVAVINPTKADKWLAERRAANAAKATRKEVEA